MRDCGTTTGAIGIFSYGGLSFGLGRRVLEVARGLAESGQMKELLLYHRLMNFIHHFLEGDWSESHFVEEELIEEGLRNGRFREVAIALDIDSECSGRLRPRRAPPHSARGSGSSRPCTEASTRSRATSST